ncbi:unnamed protein product [Caretta caretta]
MVSVGAFTLLGPGPGLISANFGVCIGARTELQTSASKKATAWLRMCCCLRNYQLPTSETDSGFYPATL